MQRIWSAAAASAAAASALLLLLLLLLLLRLPQAEGPPPSQAAPRERPLGEAGGLCRLPASEKGSSPAAAVRRFKRAAASKSRTFSAAAAAWAPGYRVVRAGCENAPCRSSDRPDNPRNQPSPPPDTLFQGWLHGHVSTDLEGLDFGEPAPEAKLGPQHGLLGGGVGEGCRRRRGSGSGVVDGALA